MRDIPNTGITKNTLVEISEISLSNKAMKNRLFCAEQCRWFVPDVTTARGNVALLGQGIYPEQTRRDQTNMIPPCSAMTCSTNNMKCCLCVSNSNFQCGISQILALAIIYSWCEVGSVCTTTRDYIHSGIVALSIAM